jgi:hypothetical protein
MKSWLTLFYTICRAFFELGLEVVHADIGYQENGALRHDPKKVAKILYNLLLIETKKRYET